MSGDQLPPSWAHADFDQVFEPQSDFGRRLAESDYQMAGLFPVIDQGEKPVGGYCDDEGLIFPGRLPVILFGDHTRRVKLVESPFIVGAQGIKILKPNEWINPRFLYHQFSIIELPDKGYSRHYQYLRKVIFIIAPVPEQDRIIGEIEKQFTRLDAATAALKRVQANLKRYRASVLKAACEGRLVPTEAELARKEGREYEPADQLLTRILHERRDRWEADTLAKMIASGKRPTDDRWKQKYKEPAAPDTTNLPELPEGWYWASLDQLAASVRNGISTKPDKESGIPILRISAVRPMAVNLDDIRFLSPDEAYLEYALEVDDLLFVRYNGNPDLSGRCGRVGTVLETVVHPDKLIRVDLCMKAAIAGWIEAVSNFGESRRHLESKTRTTAGQAGVSGADVKAMPVPLCPLSEAARISLELNGLMSAQDAVETEITKNLSRAERLRASVLTTAFSGKLVKQDPTDEPASALLDRIRAQRGSTARGKEPKRRSRREALVSSE